MQDSKTGLAGLAALSLVIGLSVPCSANWTNPIPKPTFHAESDQTQALYDSLKTAGDPEQILTIRRELKSLSPIDLENRFSLIDVLRREKRFSEAQSELAELQQFSTGNVVAAGGSDPQTRIKMLTAETFADSGSFDQALPIYQDVCDNSPTNRVEAAKGLVRCLIAQNSREQAADACRKAADAQERDGRSADAAYLRARADELDKPSKLGAQRFEVPANTSVSLPTAPSLKYQGSAPPKVTSPDLPTSPIAPYAVSTPDAGPGTAPSPLRTANNLIQEGHFDMAQTALSALLNTEPKNAEAHYLMAVTLVELRQFDEAIAEYKKVLSLPCADKLKQMASEGINRATAGPPAGRVHVSPN